MIQIQWLSESSHQTQEPRPELTQTNPKKSKETQPTQTTQYIHARTTSRTFLRWRSVYPRDVPQKFHKSLEYGLRRVMGQFEEFPKKLF